MKPKNLSSVLALLRRVRRDPRLGSAHQENLRRALREFETLARSGNLDKRRVSRAAELVCSTLVDVLGLLPGEEQVGEKKIATRDLKTSTRQDEQK